VTGLADPLSGLGLARPVVGQASVSLRVLVTLLLVAGVVAVRYLASRWRGRSDPTEGVELAVAGVVAVVTAAGVAAVIYTWGLADDVALAVGDLGAGSLAAKLLVSGVLLGAAYAFTSFVGRVISAVSSVAGIVSRHQREILYRLTQVALYSLSGLAVLGLFTDDLGGLLVGAGFLGIVVGMAARQTLGAVLAGFVLMFSRPFEIGDWVQIGDREGTVTDITVVDTRLRTIEGEHVVVPNDVVESESLVNRSREGRLRVEVEVGVDYDTDLEAATAVALEAIESVETVLEAPHPEVVVKRFADSSVVLGVRAWIRDPSPRARWRARSALVGTVKTAFEQADVRIPFPQRTLTERDVPPAEQRQGQGEETAARTGDARASADGGEPGQ
jgi:small-conductance mechanosensitive channel